MNDLDKKEFQQIVLATAELYSTVKKIEVTPVMLKLFFSALREFTIEQVSYGFEMHLGDTIDGKFFPKPANIIKHLKANEPNVEEKAALGWAQIQYRLRSSGSYGGLKIEDKQAIAALKSFITWQDFCAAPVSDQTWMQKKFMSMYVTYDKTPIEMLPSSLPGIIELHNHKEKHADQGAKSMANILEGIKKSNYT